MKLKKNKMDDERISGRIYAKEELKSYRAIKSFWEKTFIPIFCLCPLILTSCTEREKEAGIIILLILLVFLALQIVMLILVGATHLFTVSCESGGIFVLYVMGWIFLLPVMLIISLIAGFIIYKDDIKEKISED